MEEDTQRANRIEPTDESVKGAVPQKKLKDQEAGAIRIRLSEALSSRIRSTLLELKHRGAILSADELLSDYLESVPDKYFESQVVARTPDRYYLEVALESPEFKAKLLRQAKKALGNRNPASGAPQPRRRLKRAEVLTPSNLEG